MMCWDWLWDALLNTPSVTAKQGELHTLIWHSRYGGKGLHSVGPHCHYLSKPERGSASILQVAPGT